MVKRNLVAAVISIFFCVQSVFAVPDDTMSITPTAVSGETISAADENSRNNEISSVFNSHSHADIDTFTTNTFTIGDNAVGNKTYAVNTDQANDPAHRYNTSLDLWTVSNDGSTYRAVAHADDNNGFTSGAMLYGGSTSGAILSAGNGSNGQILIAQTGGAPLLGNITGSGGAVVTNGAGTIDINAAALGTPALTLGTANSAGVATTAIRTDATILAFDATTPETVGATGATGSATVAARRDHVHASNSAWAFVETLDASSGTTLTSATLPTDSDLFMVVFEGVTATTGRTIAYHPNGDTNTNKSYTLCTNATLAQTTGAAGIVFANTGSTSSKPVNGVLYCPRLASNADMFVSGSFVSGGTSADADAVSFISGHWDGGAATVTTLAFTVSGSQAFTGGKIHIYKSIPS